MAEYTVLVVDDTESNIDMLVEVLSDDYEISVAMDGKSALEIVEEDPPDLILLDIMMPDMNGFEVCQQLKAEEATKHIPIVFLSSDTDAASREKGLRLGAVDYIIKPIDREIILLKIRKHLLK